MIVEFAIGSGDPNTAQVTVTATATKLAADAPGTRQGLKYLFELLVVAGQPNRLLGDEDFFVLKMAEAIGAPGFALVQELSRFLFRRPILVLDDGVTLASLNRAQLRARMGL